MFKWRPCNQNHIKLFSVQTLGSRLIVVFAVVVVVHAFAFLKWATNELVKLSVMIFICLMLPSSRMRQIKEPTR